MTRIRFHHRASRWIARAVLGVVAAGIVAAAYLSTVGFPGWLAADFLEQVSRGQFSLAAGGVKLLFPAGVRLNRARVYRKGVVGPPAIAAEIMDLRVSFGALSRSDQNTWRLAVRNGLVRLRQMRTPPHEVGAAAAVDVHAILELEGCRVADVNVEHLRCSVRINPQGVDVSGIESIMGEGAQSGRLKGDVQYASRSRVLSGDLRMGFDPRVMMPVVKDFRLQPLVVLIERFGYRATPPGWTVRFVKEFTGTRALSLQGRFWLRDFSYRDVDLLRADGEIDMLLSADTSRIAIESLLMVREEGLGRAGFTIMPRAGLVEFEGVSRLDPLAVLTMIGLLPAGSGKVWRFDGPVLAEASGVVGYRDRSVTDFSAVVQGEQVGLGSLVATDIRGQMRMVGPTNTVSEISGHLDGGEINGLVQLVFPPAATNLMCSIRGNLKDADFGALSARFAHGGGRKGETTSYEGRLSTTLDIDGAFTNRRFNLVRGKGHVSIKDGRLFMMPVFGEFTRMVAKVVPGVDFVVNQSELKSDFKIDGNKVHTDDIKIQGDILSLTGSGDYHFNGALDFDGQVSLLKEHTLAAKIIRPITYAFSKLFEFRLRGTLSEPKWYPLHFARDIAPVTETETLPPDVGEPPPEAPTETPSGQEREDELPGVIPLDAAP